jgi:hypothetical protein
MSATQLSERINSDGSSRYAYTGLHKWQAQISIYSNRVEMVSSNSIEISFQK